MAAYAKGEKPRDLEGACGGEVLSRVKSFIKDPDIFHPDGDGMLGQANEQDYGSKGAPAKRTGDKSLPAIKARK